MRLATNILVKTVVVRAPTGLPLVPIPMVNDIELRDQHLIPEDIVAAKEVMGGDMWVIA